MTALPDRAIPLADAAVFHGAARRLAVARAVLAVGLLALLAADLALARRLHERQTTFFPAGTSGVVVLDLSTSVSLPAYGRISRILEQIVARNQPVGLVLFSDTAYEALPPGTSGTELRPLLRFFKPSDVSGLFPAVLDHPWAGSFRGGTRISAGLLVARAALARDRIEHGAVLLISDLDDSQFDIPKLTETLIDYRRGSIALRVVPLFPSYDDRQFFRQVLGPDAFVTRAELTAGGSGRAEQLASGGFPSTVTAAGLLLLALLALNERWCGRLAWRTERPG